MALPPGLVEQPAQLPEQSVTIAEPASEPVKQVQSPTGNVFIGGSSFSGVDIKAVVHVYDQGKYKRALVADRQKELAILNQRSTDLQYGRDVEVLTGLGDLAKSQQRIQENTEQIRIVQDQITNLKETIPAFQTKVLAEIQTLTISTHREKQPVRSLGTVYPKSYVRGPRAIAGSMVFTVFEKQILQNILDTPEMHDLNYGYTTTLIDQLPPFDITIAFANEYGQVSRMAIYGVELINEGQTMSIQDLMLESVVQYVARDYDPMADVARHDLKSGRRWPGPGARTASSLISTGKYNARKCEQDPFLRAALDRRRPFL